MKILVLGTWNSIKAEKYSNQAKELGRLIAEHDHTLIASPSSGIQGLVAKAYKQNGGKEFIGYYPDENLMKKVGEKTLIIPDSSIYTFEDYPIRNIMQVRESEAVIGLTGGLGTLTEIISAVEDYNLPTAFYKNSSNKRLIDKFFTINQEFKSKIIYDTNLSNMLLELENRYKSK